jgi:hypothetical protein
MDFTIIIAILAAVAISIVKDSRKKQAQQASDADREEFEPIEPAPRAEDEPLTWEEIVADANRRMTADPLQELRRKIAEKKRQMAEMEAEEQQQRAESLETIIDEEEAFYASQQPHKAARPTAPAKPAKKAVKSPQKPAIETTTVGKEKNAQPKEEVHELVRDFDLERAVVYSEIMEPKFKSYE